MSKKIVICGSEQSGKSMLTQAMVAFSTKGGGKEWSYEEPYANDLQIKSIKTNSKSQHIEYSIWDPSGQEKHAKLENTHHHWEEIRIYCIAMDSWGNSLRYVENHLKELQLNESTGIIMVATKSDLASDRIKDERKIQDFFDGLATTYSTGYRHYDLVLDTYVKRKRNLISETQNIDKLLTSMNRAALCSDDNRKKSDLKSSLIEIIENTMSQRISSLKAQLQEEYSEKTDDDIQKLINTWLKQSLKDELLSNQEGKTYIEHLIPEKSEQDDEEHYQTSLKKCLADKIYSNKYHKEIIQFDTKGLSKKDKTQSSQEYLEKGLDGYNEVKKEIIENTEQSLIRGINQSKKPARWGHLGDFLVNIIPTIFVLPILFHGAATHTLFFHPCTSEHQKYKRCKKVILGKKVKTNKMLEKSYKRQLPTLHM